MLRPQHRLHLAVRNCGELSPSVVRVGRDTDCNQLNQTAESHIRLNRNHSYTVFRVRVDGLKPGITYYYTVDSMGGDGTRDGVESTVYQFTTPADPQEP